MSTAERRDVFDPGPGRTWLFVYGLLKPGFRPPATMTEAWPDAVCGKLYDLGPYPALVDVCDWPGDGQPKVVAAGFTLNIAKEELRELDAFEGVDEGLYRRDRFRTQSGFSAWVYVYAQPLPPDAVGPLSEWQPAES